MQGYSKQGGQPIPPAQMVEESSAPTPPQYNLGAAPAADFRFAALGPIGMSKKRKMAYDEQVSDGLSL